MTWKRILLLACIPIVAYFLVGAIGDIVARAVRGTGQYRPRPGMPSMGTPPVGGMSLWMAAAAEQRRAYAAPPEPPPTPVKIDPFRPAPLLDPGTFHVEAVASNGRALCALVNGDVVFVGSEIGEYIVKSIDADGVMLDRYGLKSRVRWQEKP